MNKGIKLASGEYVNFMNGGDEFYDNDVLAKVFNGKEYDADVIYGRTYMVGKNYIKEPKIIMNKQAFYKNNIVHQSAFTKTVLQKKYLFDETLKICSDYDFFVKILFKGFTFKYINIIVSKFDTGGISETNRQLGINEISIIRKRYYNFILKIKYDPKWKQKLNHYIMILTHPRYVAGWIKRKIKNMFNKTQKQLTNT